MTALELNDRGHLAYQDEGHGQPIVFLHGWSLRKEVFWEQSALSARFRVIVPDLRGHGESSLVDGDDGMATLADDLTELLIRLDLSETIVAGWSMGAMSAWDLLQRRAADRVAGIVSIDMVPRILNDETWSYGLRPGGSAGGSGRYIARMRANWRAFTKEYVPKIFARGKGAERRKLVERLMAMVEHNDLKSMVQLWKSMAAQDYRRQVTDLNVPSLITYGKLSQLYPEEASKWMESNIPNSRRVCFANSGHAPHIEEPERFNREIETFADEIRELENGRSRKEET